MFICGGDQNHQDVNYSLLSAVREGRLESAMELINSFGLCYSKGWSGGYVLLRDALKNKHAAVAKLLLTSGSRVNSNKKNTDTPLHFAIINGDIEIVKMILDKGANIDAQDHGGRTPLHFAVINGDIEIIKMILNEGANIDAQDHDGRTPLHFAVINGDIKIVTIVLGKGANIDAKNKYGRTPLHDTIENKKMEVTELLLRHRANVNATDNVGRNSLHVAAEIGCSKIVKHLLEYGAYVDCMRTSIWYQGYVPLHFAVENGSKKVVSLLLSSGATVDVKGGDSITPLHIAAKMGYIRIAKDLLNHGACIHSLTKEGYTPLHFASERDDGEAQAAVKLFLNRDADINASTKNSLTPLHIATKTGHETVVKLLLQRTNGANVDSQDKDSKTILHLAVDRGNLMTVKDVLKYCPNITDQSNRSSLNIAVCRPGEEYKNIVEALLEYGLKVNPEDKNSPELLHAAVKNGYLKIIEDLLKYGADVNMLNNSTEGFTPLHNAAINKQEEVAQLLISYESDINAQDKTGKTPIFYAIEDVDSEITNILNNSRFKEGFTPLHSAAKIKQDNVAKLLIRYEADINAQDSSGKTPIFYAIENADLKNTKLLLTNGAIIKDSPELLNIAVNTGCIEIVEALLQHDADVNAYDKYGRTALNYTALNESFYFEFPNPYNIRGEDPCNITRGEIAKLLLSKGANVEAQTKDCLTTLHAAIHNGYAEVVEALLEYNANVNSGINNRETPLQYSAQKGHKEISKMLLNKGANVNAMEEDRLQITALQIATWIGDEELVKVLLEFGADINSLRDAHGRTALHIASEEGNKDVVVTLLGNGADINITSRNNHTALDLTMPGIRTSYGSDDEYYYNPDRSKVTAEALNRHIVKMKTANFYVSEKNILSMSSSDEISDFQDECEKELASMKSEKINNLNTSFYDILVKDTSSLAIYMRNENIVQVLKSEKYKYKTKFPIYASMIQSNFRKGMERKELLEQGNKIFHFLFNNFPELPYNCTEKIFSYLSDEDIRILMDACKPLGICNPNDVVIGCFNNSERAGPARQRRRRKKPLDVQHRT